MSLQFGWRCRTGAVTIIHLDPRVDLKSKAFPRWYPQGPETVSELEHRSVVVSINVMHVYEHVSVVMAINVVHVYKHGYVVMAINVMHVYTCMNGYVCSGIQ